MDIPNEHRRIPDHEVLTPQRIDNQLAKRRRKSYPKACYPCRCRKVRCDHNHPCGNCIKYEQPKLCAYLDHNGQLRREQNPIGPKASNTSAKDRVAALADLERRMQAIAEEVVRRLGSLGAGTNDQPLKPHQIEECEVVETPSFQGRRRHEQIPATNAQPGVGPAEVTGTPLHLGAESLASILANILKSAQPAESSPQSSDGGDILGPSAHETMKLLYMTDTGSTYPFASLWKPGATVEEICLALPDDDTFELCLASFYQSVNLVSPSIPLHDFEADFRDFWRERSTSHKKESELRSPSWLALLFSVLASGCSYNSVSRAANDLSSRVFVCCAFELLRLDNYLLQPTIDNVRVLAGLSGILRDQANPAASWSLLGMAIRSAQSIGIHCMPQPTDDCSDVLRQSWKLWQGLVWQDTILSLCYDRPCIAFVDGSINRIPRSTSPEGLPYLESCYGLAMVMNDIYHEWTHIRRVGSKTLPAVRFQVAIQQILLWGASAQEYLRDRASCRDDTQRLLHNVFQIFVNFFIFQLQRHHLAAPPLFTNGLQIAAAPSETPCVNQEAKEDESFVYVDRCETVLRLFLSLRRSHYQASRLWILMHICLSCSFFLASQLKKARDQHGEIPNNDTAKARHQLLRDLTKNFEQSIPSAIHPHQMEILKMLKLVIGMSS